MLVASGGTVEVCESPDHDVRALCRHAGPLPPTSRTPQREPPRRPPCTAVDACAVLLSRRRVIKSGACDASAVNRKVVDATVKSLCWLPGKVAPTPRAFAPLDMRACARFFTRTYGREAGVRSEMGAGRKRTDATRRSGDRHPARSGRK